MTGIRSSLASHVASGPTSPEDIRRKAAAAWHSDGIILINPDWLTSWTERKQAEILAEKLFGRRKGESK